MAIENAMGRISREVGVKKCIIVDGNVSDVYSRGNRIVTIKEYLMGMMSDIGYEDVVYWDRITGIEGDVHGLQLVDDIEDYEGDQYDMGIEEEEIMKPQSTTGSCKEVQDIMNVVLRTMNDPDRRTVFILNWTDFIFTAGQLDPLDRLAITALGKALRDLPPEHNAVKRASTVILIADKASALPLALYNANSEVGQVTITKPDREEREEMLKKIGHNFSIRGVNDIRDSEKFQEYVDMLSEFTNREIIQIANMSKFEDIMTFEKLFYLFKYGEKENPWEKLNTEKVRDIKEILSRRVIGQDEAIDKVEEVVIKAFMGLTGMHKASSRSMPKGVLFFVGPTGVGKTELSKALASFLFGEDTACIRFDMSEYAQENSDQKLIGAPPGYVGYEEGGQLTNAVREKPFSVVLFDEIEKAAKPNPRILDIFLQILEDGRLTDSRGETTYFSDTIIIFTSNLGAAEVSNSFDKEKVAEEFIQIVKDYFDKEIGRPEILGRIGMSNIVPFNFINDPGFAVMIAKSKMKPISDSIWEKYKIELEVKNDAEFFNHIISSVDTSKGGRDILNALDDSLLSPLSQFLFLNYDDLRRFKGARLILSVEKDELKFTFED